MIEKERKFLLKYLPEYDKIQHIKQGYLLLEGNKHLRVRIIDDSDALLTYKLICDDRTKIEYEYNIPISDGLEMYKSTDKIVEKVRYKTTFNGMNVDIDVYGNGISVVEIEYDDELTMLPDYCGDEVTGLSEYSNIRMALEK